MRSKVFIGSSAESLNIAYAIQQNLRKTAETTVWDQGVFELSKTTIESLVEILSQTDFGIFVFSPDDIVKIRSNESLAVRDNVIFELGLFIGCLGRERSFIIIPESTDFRLPTDLLGITAGTYEANRSDGSWQAATVPASQQIKQSIKKYGPREDRDPNDSPVDEKKLSDRKEDSVDWLDLYIDNKNVEAIEELRGKIKNEESAEKKLELELWIAKIEWELDYVKGEDIFKQIIEKNNDNPVPYIAYYNTLYWNDDLENALKMIDQILDKFPEKELYVNNKAQCLMKMGSEDDAVKLLSDAITDKPNEIFYQTLLKF